MLLKKISVLTTLLYFGFTCIIHAQKLANVQEKGLRAPSNAKVDGSPLEWGDKFQAYNHATDLFYTMANDDENLYLVIQTADPKIVSRIMPSGLTLSVLKGNLKNDNNGVNITYPVTRSALYFGLQRKKIIIKDTSAHALDSIMRRHNKMIDDSCKFIRVSGIPGVDTLISVYNRDGIKARAQFNNKKVFTCEFAIKLKLLGLTKDNSTKFTYHIIVNGIKSMILGDAPVLVGGVPDAKMTTSLNDFFSKNNAPTDFWGEYILSKQ